MNCNEMFNAGICYVTDAYKTVCKFNEELHADLEKYRDENAELRELLQRTWDAFHDAPAREFFYVKNKLRELGIEVDA